jgi:hypothetical protein
MRRAVLLSALLVFSAAIVPSADASPDAGAPVDGGVPAPANVFYLLMGFSAQETCSCVFVDGQTDDYCSAYGQEQGYSTTVTIDHTAKTASAAFGAASRTARATDTGGCTLDPLP